MNRSALSKKTLNKQRPRVDRFIVPREDLHDLHWKLTWDCNEKGTDDLSCTKYLQQKRYSSYLDSTFDLEAIAPKINSTPEQNKYIQLWPCLPRKHSYLSSADSILDLPTYSYAPFPELLDWSNDNILVAALGRHYHKWSWRTQSQLSMGISDFNIQCCKFDPKGQRLILGTDTNIVEIHNTEHNKRVESSSCLCATRCSITALDWSPTGNSYITGCSQGTVVSFTHNALMISHNSVWSTSPGAVLMVRVSPDARYVAVTTINDSHVILMTWPQLELVFTFKSEWTVKALAWHPWRSALLGVGEISSNVDTHVCMWDAPTGDVRKESVYRENYCLDAMLFSKRTGELVLGLWNTDRETSITTRTQLLVMSGADNVVDQWGEGIIGLDRIRTMLFSPDGSKFATATAGEDLIIYNFLPEDKRKKHKTCKRFSAIPVYLDKTSGRGSFR